MSSPPVPPAPDRPWLEELPKVELHLHLEGAIPLPALWELVVQHGGDPDVPDFAALEARFAYRDFPHFLRVWSWKTRFLREPADFAFAAEAVARDLARQRVLHAELFFSPPDFAATGLGAGRIAEALRAGLDRVPELSALLVADLVRDAGPAAAMRTLAEVAELGALGVVGVGLGGSEHEFPARWFADVFADARRRGLRTSCHAGEAAGPESVREALELLAVDRVGHGTRAAEDPALVDELARRGTPLELCPLSNVRTGAIRELAAHPVRAWFDRGLRLSVSTDDPAMFHTSLAGEFAALREAHGFARDEIRALVRMAAEDCWLDGDAKRALLARLEAESG